MISWMFLVETAVISSILFGLYFLLRPFLSNWAKRYTLLFVPLLSIVVVVLKMNLVSDSAVLTVPIVELDPVTVDGGSETASSSTFSWQLIYLLGCLTIFVALLFKIIRLFVYFRKAVPFIHRPDLKILVSSKEDSFSFFNRIHLSAEMDEDEKQVVLEHEILHCDKFHSLDLILMEVYHALFWFNPLMVFMKKELVQVHEYEVDQELYKKYDAKYLRHLLSYSLGASVAHLLLTSQFYRKMTLAKRIRKMKHNKTPKRYATLLIPAAALCFMLTSWTYSSMDVPASSSFTPTIQKTNGELDKEPQYKGGNEALFAFIGENVVYPKSAEKDNLEGTVLISFIVQADGSLSDFKVVKGEHKILNDEALRVVSMMPNWIPGEKDGKKVKAEMKLPVKFKL